jgi:hypothetical protein
MLKIRGMGRGDINWFELAVTGSSRLGFCEHGDEHLGCLETFFFFFFFR